MDEQLLTKKIITDKKKAYEKYKWSKTASDFLNGYVDFKSAYRKQRRKKNQKPVRSKKKKSPTKLRITPKFSLPTHEAKKKN